MSKIKKPKSLKTPLPIVTPTNKSETDAQFELELCWCVQQLERALDSGKLSQKVAEDTVKNLKVLKGKNAPLIKKRQVMKSSMGDYRAKMKEEERQMALASKQIKFTSTAEAIKKSSFVKKSAILTSSKDFKFNFDTTTLQDSPKNQQLKEINQCSNANNLPLGTGGIEFKFNFDISKEKDDMKFDELSIK